MNKTYKKNKIFLRPLIATFLILIIPFFGTLFIDGWLWGILDFVIMGTLIFITGLMLELAHKKIKNKNYKILAFSGILSTLFLIWVELATDGVSIAMGEIFGIY